MYPYNTPNSVQDTNNLNTRESTLTTMSLQHDEKLLNLLQIALQEAEDSAQTYQKFLNEKEMEKDFPILRTAYLDEIKHQNLIREIYYQIFHEHLSSDNTDTEVNHKGEYLHYLDSLENMLLSELENMDFYRELFSLIPDNPVKDMLLEIIMDKQDHSVRLQHLYCKYKK